MGSKESLSEIESILDKQGALRDFRSLVKAGCNCSELETALDIFGLFAANSWKDLLGGGMDLRRFRSAIEGIRNCANIIERLNRSYFLIELSGIILHPGLVDIHKTPTLPERLREYADNLDFCRNACGPKRAIRLNLLKANLVALVKEATNKPHDKEVSALISAFLNKGKEYTAVEHKMWRQRHTDEINVMKQRVRDRHVKRAMQSASATTSSTNHPSLLKDGR